MPSASPNLWKEKREHYTFNNREKESKDFILSRSYGSSMGSMAWWTHLFIGGRASSKTLKVWVIGLQGWIPVCFFFSTKEAGWKVLLRSRWTICSRSATPDTMSRWRSCRRSIPSASMSNSEETNKELLSTGEG